MTAKELEKKSDGHNFQIISSLDRFYYIIFFPIFHVSGFSITRLTLYKGHFQNKHVSYSEHSVLKFEQSFCNFEILPLIFLFKGT